MQSWQGEGWLSDVFHVLEQKLREDLKQAMLCITNDASELPTCLEIIAGDSESRVTVICSSASDVPDQVEIWQDKADCGLAT